jgi:type IV secretory pathway VirB10-like protein
VTNGAPALRERRGYASRQRYTGAMKSLRVTLLGLALAVPALCFAQWQWVDKDGRKVFSDQPPPADVPAKNILKQPGGKGARSVPVPESAEASVPAKPAAPAPKVSGKDKDLEEKRRQAEAAAAKREQAQEEELAKQRADSCDRAKRAKAIIDYGQRLQQVNSKGEREVMDDAARAIETKRLEGIVARDCKPA